jgi:predicted acetyltransferase
MKAESYEGWLEKITLARTAELSGFVVGSTYFAFADGKIVGTISVRNYLTESLLRCGGHIGYAVRPSERRKGYGAGMLSLALEKCRALGIREALVTCDKDNIASAKTILNNGGVLENELIDEKETLIQRYWVKCQ